MKRSPDWWIDTPAPSPLRKDYVTEAEWRAALEDLDARHAACESFLRAQRLVQQLQGRGAR